MGLSISPWITRRITQKLCTYLADKKWERLAYWTCDIDRLLFLASFLSFLIINVTNAGLTAFSAYKARDIREYSILGVTVIGFCVSSSVSFENTYIKILSSTLKLARCYFAKSKVEKVAFGLWVAYDLYDGFFPPKDNSYTRL